MGLTHSLRVIGFSDLSKFQHIILRFVCKFTEIIIQSAYNLCWNLENPLLGLCSHECVFETTNIVTIFAVNKKYLLQIIMKKYCKQRRCSFLQLNVYFLQDTGICIAANKSAYVLSV